MQAFGGVLRARRLSRGLTQEELSRLAGVSVRAVRDIERGRVRRPRKDSVRRLAAVVGLDPAALDERPGVDRLQIKLLGPLTVHRADAPVDVGPPRQRCVLGLLGLQPNRVVRQEEIIDVLWGAHPQATSRNMVHAYVSRLRRLLPPWKGMTLITGGDGGYRLTVDSDQLDLLRFDELVARAAADPGSALDLYAQALACWRGPVLADLTARLRRHPAAVALARRHVDAVLAYADLAIAAGLHQGAEEQLRALTAEEPLHEGAHARLMLALAGSGRRAAALDLFAEVRGRLVEELGLEPGLELRDVQAQVLRGELPLAGARPGPAQLPADVVGFTGRTDHLARLDGLLPMTGAVVITTIAGMAGVGKTALAVHWAHRVAGRFADGQLYINLQGHASASPVRPLQALAGWLRALGVRADAVPVDLEEAATLYRSLLAGRRMLVVLDNAANAEQVRSLLPGSPGSFVVLTSRDRLTGLMATHGVHRLTLGVLTPAESVALLSRMLGADRVNREPEAAAELARVCGRLPLALRIAAANLTDRPARSIAGHVAALRTDDRLSELAVDDDPQVAVRVAFDRSYTRLGPDVRRMFRELALAPGADLSLPAAAALASHPPEQVAKWLGRLVDVHLLEQRGAGRYGLHDLLRLYAQERSEHEDSTRERAAALERLLDWYLCAADRAAALLYPGMLRLPLPAIESAPTVEFGTSAEAVAWLDTELANLIAAVQHAAEHGPHRTSWLLADSLRGYFWLRRSTVDWLEIAGAARFAAERAGDVRAQAAAEHGLGGAYQGAGRYQEAIEHYSSELTLARRAGWTGGEAVALGALGMAHWWSGALREAADYHAQALALHRQRDPKAGANSLLNLGLVYRDLGRLDEAAGHLAESLTLHRIEGARDGEAHVLGALGEIEHDRGELDHARRHLDEALALHRDVGDRFGEGYVLGTLAAVHRDAGRPDQALDLARTALTLAGEIGHLSAEARIRNILGRVHLRLGDRREASDQHRHALDLARQTSTRAAEAGALLGLAAVHAGRPRESLDYAERALTLAARTGLRILEGQAYTLLAAARHGLGDHDRAAEDAGRALDLHRRTGHHPGAADALRVLEIIRAD
jgi:DNA-binding SARP family transcriptional activator/tetratricopeptide (TPR) repeat protein/DNA-binding XRE family transcriptional regulator